MKKLEMLVPLEDGTAVKDVQDTFAKLQKSIKNNKS